MSLALAKKTYSQKIMRDDFPSKIKEEVAKRVGYLCSKPDCRAPTSCPKITSGVVNVGVAAHITAASINGPRYDASLNKEQRSSADNAIWLCQTHAKQIDSDLGRFEVSLLRQWKSEAETYAANNIGKAQQSTASANEALLLPQVVAAYKAKGTPKYFLDSLDLTNEQRARLYDKAIYSEKGRFPNNNPYK